MTVFAIAPVPVFLVIFLITGLLCSFAVLKILTSESMSCLKVY
jgi:hypothetical protein